MFRASTSHNQEVRYMYVANGTSKMTVSEPGLLTVIFFDIMVVGGDVEDATNKLQRAADEISNWTDQWLNKLNGDKSTRVTLEVPFTTHTHTHIYIYIYIYLSS
jgi:hypothetical protein